MYLYISCVHVHMYRYRYMYLYSVGLRCIWMQCMSETFLQRGYDTEEVAIYGYTHALMV